MHSGRPLLKNAFVSLEFTNDALERISITAEKLSAGEILQIEKSMTRSMDEDTYFDMIPELAEKTKVG